MTAARTSASAVRTCGIVAALALLLAACTATPDSRQISLVDAPKQTAMQTAAEREHQRILASYGGVYENAQLHEQLVEQRLFEQDLDLARRVQQAFLPAKHPDLEGFSFYHFYQPAQQIGGDYFDYIPLPDERIAIVVADVVGHGVSAAMLMAKLSAETRFALASSQSVNRAIGALNARMSGLGVEKFITFLCLVLDPKSGEPTRTRRQIDEDGTKERIAVKSGEALPRTR